MEDRIGQQDMQTSESTTVTAPSPKTRKRWLRGFGVMAVILVAVVALFAVCGKTYTPAEMFVRVQKRALIDTVAQVLTGMGDVESEAEGFSDDITLTMDMYGTMYVTVKADIEPGGESGVFGVSYGTQGMKIDLGTFTYTKEQLGFHIPLLDRNYYVMDYESLEGWINEMLPEQEQVDLDMFLREPIVFEAADLWNKYSDIVLSVIKEENVTEDEVSLDIQGQTIACKRYIFQPTAQDLETMFTQLLTELKADEELREIIWAMLELGRLETVEPDAYPSWEEFTDVYETGLEEALDSAGQLAREIADQQIKWSVAVAKEKVYQQLLEENGEIVLCYETAGTAKDQRYAALEILPGQANGVGFVSSMTRQESHYVGTVELYSGEELYGDLKYDMDFEDCSSIGMPMGGFSLVSDGDMWSFSTERNEDGGVDHWMRMNYLGESVEIKITTTEKESTVEVPDTTPVDISGYSIEQLEQLFAVMGGSLMGDEYY